MTEEDLMKWLKNCRNCWLKDTEQFGFGVSDRQWPDGWAEYRQELRDLPQKIASGEIDAPVFNAEKNIPEFSWPEQPQSFIDLQ